jgi:hypothetical protein
MLRIVVKGDEFFDEETSSFITLDDVVLDLEHSLISLSKWESKFEKPFLSSGDKTSEEVYGYIQAMVVTQDFPQETVFRLSRENIKEINDYIDSKQSATTFGDMPKPPGRSEVITSELIYYWMVGFNIPFECERWHLNRLFSLIRICNIKQSKPKKMSRGELAARNRELNAQRKARLGTTG